MNEIEIEQLMQKLQNLRAELVAHEQTAREGAVPAELYQADMDRLSRRDAMQAQQAAEEGTRQRKRQIQKIDGALRRIKMGEYGKCFVCEEEIDMHRLAEDPTITRCPNCVEP